jgi:hypothetical protein
MPEPPAFDINGLNKNDGITPASQPKAEDGHYIPAANDTVPGGSIVRVTNLDRTEPVSATSAEANGSFAALVNVTDGQELRFEWVDGTTHSAPGDVIFRQAAPGAAFDLLPSPRFDCLKLSPSFALEYGGVTTATLSLENGCSDALTLANPRSRLTLTDYTLATTLPVQVAAQASRELRVDFARTAAGLREDVLFVDVTLADTTIRYPITLRSQ